MENSKKQSYFPYILGVISVLVIGLIVFSIYQENQNPPTGRQQVLDILGKGIDTSNSRYSEEDLQIVLAEIEETRKQIEDSVEVDPDVINNLARQIKTVRDFDTAIKLYEVTELFNPAAKTYLVEKGKAYLELQQWDKAREVFENLHFDGWAVFESYLGLATAYQNIPDTPNYVIDGIFEEGIYATRARFGLVEAYAEWLEETGRSAEAVPYYEIMYEKNPQQSILDKIEEIKEKNNK